MRASKKRLSSLIGEKTGKPPAKLDLELALVLVGVIPGNATGAPLARLSRSEAALRADLEIKVADPSEMFFLWPCFLVVLLATAVTVSSDFEAGSDAGSGRTSVL